MESVGKFEKHAGWFSYYRYGAMSLMLIILGCYGAIAAMVSMMNEFMIGVYIASVVAMASNAVLIAQLSPKACLKVFYFGAVVCTFIFIYNIFI